MLEYSSLFWILPSLRIQNNIPVSSIPEMSFMEITDSGQLLGLLGQLLEHKNIEQKVIGTLQPEFSLMMQMPF